MAFWLTGYSGLTIHVAVSSGETASGNVTLSPLPAPVGSIAGSGQSSVDSSPLIGATVTLDDTCRKCGQQDDLRFKRELLVCELESGILPSGDCLDRLYRPDRLNHGGNGGGVNSEGSVDAKRLDLDCVRALEPARLGKAFSLNALPGGTYEISFPRTSSNRSPLNLAR